ncbi:Lrp/AsnC ligand binding domain-containing protein [Paraburkholderia atlantica]|uniref:Lrp/AsnC ligand binding domain-containing protein n=1 Tax=Paraburkholderia atlantica TaxID=2654982 RepID=UPI001791A947|nr:Lrp/AsnC ligand binding domain-containing protein [Paraburkholderia atlantica]MBB5507426.1 DNA-binding Lrp family transcriptional regulator [Paraburkholderia atlantica]
MDQSNAASGARSAATVGTAERARMVPPTHSRQPVPTNLNPESIPEITRAERLFGDPDYMLHVVTRDLKAFQMLYDRYLLTLPCVLRLSSTLVMKSIFEDRPLPL